MEVEFSRFLAEVKGLKMDQRTRVSSVVPGCPLSSPWLATTCQVAKYCLGGRFVFLEETLFFVGCKGNRKDTDFPLRQTPGSVKRKVDFPVRSSASLAWNEHHARTRAEHLIASTRPAHRWPQSSPLVLASPVERLAKVGTRLFFYLSCLFLWGNPPPKKKR